jgi:cytochrome c biogenesis protein CcdA
MSELLMAAGTALWLGILTSISPCPLATNIAAISFIGRRVAHGRQVLLSGVLYTLGRVIAYAALGIILAVSILSVTELSFTLQRYMNKLMGPLLIIVGMFLLELLSFNSSGAGVSEKMQQRVERMGIWGAVPLGFVFALSFCPVSAALFFGSLIPLCLKSNSIFTLPTLYGVGTALPVIVFAVAIAIGAQSVAKLFEQTKRIEWWARHITGAIFILVGVYFCLRYIFDIL